MKIFENIIREVAMTKSSLLRQRCLLDYGAIKSTRAVALRNDVSKSSISAWVCQARGSVLKKKPKNNNRHHNSTLLIINNYVKENPFTTLRDLPASKKR